MDHGQADSADCKVSMLWNWNTVDACFLSSSWQILNGGMMAASCIGVALLVVILEALKLTTKKYDTMILAQMRRRGAVLLEASSASTGLADDTALKACPVTTPAIARPKIVLRASPVQQMFRAVLHAVTFGVGYIVMLLAMYFNGYIIISIVIGAGIGKFLCDWLSCTMEEKDVSPKVTGIEEPTVCCQ